MRLVFILILAVSVTGTWSCNFVADTEGYTFVESGTDTISNIGTSSNDDIPPLNPTDTQSDGDSATTDNIGTGNDLIPTDEQDNTNDEDDDEDNGTEEAEEETHGDDTDDTGEVETDVGTGNDTGDTGENETDIGTGNDTGNDTDNSTRDTGNGTGNDTGNETEDPCHFICLGEEHCAPLGRTMMSGSCGDADGEVCCDVGRVCDHDCVPAEECAQTGGTEQSGYCDAAGELVCCEREAPCQFDCLSIERCDYEGEQREGRCEQADEVCCEPNPECAFACHSVEECDDADGTIYEDMNCVNGGDVCCDIPDVTSCEVPLHDFLTASTEGWIDKCDNPFQIQGSAYAFGDDDTMDTIEIDFDDAPEGEFCISGTAAEVEDDDDWGNHWGGGLGIDLCQNGSADVPQDRKYTIGDCPRTLLQNIDGFSFEIDADTFPETEIRVIFAEKGRDENPYFPMTSDGSETVDFGDVVVVWAEDAGEDWDPLSEADVEAIQFQVATQQGGSVDFDFCIRNIRPFD